MEFYNNINLMNMVLKSKNKNKRNSNRDIISTCRTSNKNHYDNGV